jgi:hypothetical protein
MMQRKTYRNEESEKLWVEHEWTRIEGDNKIIVIRNIFVNSGWRKWQASKEAVEMINGSLKCALRIIGIIFSRVN